MKSFSHDPSVNINLTRPHTQNSANLHLSNLKKTRRFSLKPYYYNNTGNICKNPLPAKITYSTSPNSPLKYRPLGCKFQEISVKIAPKRKLTKNSTDKKGIPLETSLTTKEVFVLESGTELNSENISGFYYKINRNPMPISDKKENLQNFLLKCQKEFHKNKKFKYIHSATGKTFKFLQDFPLNEKVLFVSNDIHFKELDAFDTRENSLLQIEEKFSNKTSKISYNLIEKFTPAKASKSRDEYCSKNTKLNINQLKIKLGQIAVKIDSEFPKLNESKMKKLRQKCSFPESSIHKLYAKFKMLVHLTIAKNPALSIWTGISREVFIEAYNGTPELNYLLDRIFDSIDQDGNGFISWEEYLFSMDVMFNGTYEQQIDLFFSVYDTDGNGRLSFEEIRDLCKIQLQNSKADSVVEELSKSFASLIFDMTETPYDSEIPPDKIKEVLIKETDKSMIEMFCSFSFMKTF